MQSTEVVAFIQNCFVDFWKFAGTECDPKFTVPKIVQMHTIAKLEVKKNKKISADKKKDW